MDRDKDRGYQEPTAQIHRVLVILSLSWEQGWGGPSGDGGILANVILAG